MVGELIQGDYNLLVIVLLENKKIYLFSFFLFFMFANEIFFIFFIVLYTFLFIFFF